MNKTLDKKRVIIIAVLCMIGLLLTAELAYVFYKANFLTSAPPSFCTISSTIDCDGVAKTKYALFLGVPLALWGILLYVLMLFLAAIDVLKQKYSEVKNFFFDVFKNPRSYIAAIGLLSFIISMCLAFVSIFKIGKVCALCFVTYFINLIIAFVGESEGNFFFTDIKNTIKDFLDGAKKYPLLLAGVIMIAAGILTYTSVSSVFSPNALKARSIEIYRQMKTNPYSAQGNILGKENGKIQIYLYSDFMCPFCRLTNIMIHQLVQEDDEVEVHHMNFPLDRECNKILVDSMHPGACTLAKYALAAKEQGNYWGMVNALYDSLPNNENKILELGEKMGLDKEKLRKDAHSKAIEEILNSQLRIAQNSHISGTPSMAINGIIYAGGMSYPEIKTLVKQAMKRYERDMGVVLP